MLSYYGYTISPNQIETGEGFLICRNVPIARTGDQEYLGSEIGLDHNDLVTVRRPPEEVFSDAALASFEGKPVTDDHPPELLDPDNVSAYLKGHAEQVRKGTGEWEGYVIADLHIQDRTLINAVQNGKREISCGYECEYVDNGDGTFSQKNIIGNHVAVVERGRAGKRAAILDSDKKKAQAGKQPERKRMKKNGLFLKLFGMSVKDKSPEEIEQMAMDAADALEEGGEQTPPAAGVKEPEISLDAGAPAADGGIDVEAIVKALAQALGLEKPAEEPKDPIDAAIEKLTGEKKTEGGEAKVVPAESGSQGGGAMDNAVVAALLKKMQPAVANIQDAGSRKAVADALISALTSDDLGDMAKLAETVQANARAVADKKPQMDADAVQAAYDAFNPHKKKNGGQ